MNSGSLKAFLEEKVAQYNHPSFIENDPIFVPHQFTVRQDIEIAGLIAAVFAWGQRKTIINKSLDFLARMDNDPYQFVLHAGEEDLMSFIGFKHRTFNDTDALYFLHFFRWYYEKYTSLEDAFVNVSPKAVEAGLNNFSNLFFSLPNSPDRTRRHIPDPRRKSACKRLNMFLRWMVRRDHKGVDFGIWKRISPSDLICPCDLHVDRIARRFRLISRKQTDWETAIELTESLKKFDASDPVKYDFALFGLGLED